MINKKYDFLDLSIKATAIGVETDIQVNRETTGLISRAKHIDEDLLAIKIAKECACFMDKLEELLK